MTNQMKTKLTDYFHLVSGLKIYNFRKSFENGSRFFPKTALKIVFWTTPLGTKVPKRVLLFRQKFQKGSIERPYSGTPPCEHTMSPPPPREITLRLPEHTNIFLNIYPVVAFCHLSLQPLPPCTRSQQCFTTATIRSFVHFEHLELPLSLYCDWWHLLAANSKLVENFETGSEYLL